MPADLPTLQRSPMPRQRLSSTGVTEYWAEVRGSLRLDAGGLDHFGPLFGFGSNVLAEISGWATERCGAEVGKPRLDLGIGEASVDCPVEGFDHLCRRAFRRTEAAPEAPLITRQESIKVGISGSASERVVVVTAKARSLADLTYWIDEGMPAK